MGVGLGQEQARVLVAIRGLNRALKSEVINGQVHRTITLMETGVQS